MSPVCRDMTENDLPRVLDIQKKLAFQSWTEEQFRDEIALEYSHCRVLSEGEGVLGYAVSHLLSDEAELLSIAVSPEVGRKGLGTLLWEDARVYLKTKGAVRCFLEVRAGNAAAQNFYLKLGFSSNGVRKKYYSDGEDARLFFLTL